MLGRNCPQHVKLLLHKYHALFKDELGTMTGVQARLSVKPDSTP